MRYLLWIIAALSIGIYICNPLQDPDLWWHITVGRWIIEHQTVPHTDYWSFFSAGEPWRAYSWSAEILFAFVDGISGEHGLLVVKLLLASFLALSFSFVFSQIARDWFLGLLLGVFSAAACYNHFTLRPQTFIWIYFTWLVFISFRVDGINLNAKSFLGLFVIMALWANMHLSAAIGLGVVFLSLVEEDGLSVDLRKLPWPALFVCFLGTLVTPYLGGEWLTFFSTSSHPFQFNQIAEFQPANILQYSTGFLILSYALVLSVVFVTPRLIEISKLLCMLFLLIGALAVIKFLPFAIIYSSAVFALAWRRINQHNPQGALPHLVVAIKELKSLSLKIPREGLSFLFLCTIIVRVYQLWHYPLELQTVPALAVDFIQNNKLKTPVLNNFGTGGYLMYRFSDSKGNPSTLIPIDGRTNLISHKLWENYMQALRGRTDWSRYIEMVDPGTILWKSDSSFPTILEIQGDWCRVYRDGDEVNGYQVFIRKDEWISKSNELPSDNCRVS